MLGYYKMRNLLKEVLQNGWFKTGDYGRMNEKGQLNHWKKEKSYCFRKW